MERTFLLVPFTTMQLLDGCYPLFPLGKEKKKGYRKESAVRWRLVSFMLTPTMPAQAVPIL